MLQKNVISTILGMCFRTYPYIPQPGFGIPQADLIVSELLGSFADNELSPECLDGAGAMGGTCGMWSLFGAEHDLYGCGSYGLMVVLCGPEDGQ